MSKLTKIADGHHRAVAAMHNTPSLLGRNIFDELFGDFPTLARKSTSGYPVADIFSNEDGSTTLEFALAGFSKEDLTIEIQPEKSSLTVCADASAEGDSNRRIARRSFQKTFVNYDNNLDLMASTADFHNGLLSVTIPRKAEVQPVVIDIN